METMRSNTALPSQNFLIFSQSEDADIVKRRFRNRRVKCSKVDILWNWKKWNYSTQSSWALLFTDVTADGRTPIEYKEMKNDQQPTLIIAAKPCWKLCLDSFLMQALSSVENDRRQYSEKDVMIMLVRFISMILGKQHIHINSLGIHSSELPASFLSF